MTERVRASISAGLGVLLAGCVGAMPLADFSAAGPAMRAEAFFAGTTRGHGVLETRGGRPSQPFEVAGEGAILPDGRFRLRQTLSWGDGRCETREWLLRRDGPRGYRGTLTGAAGDVRGEVSGRVFHLRYHLAAPMVRREQYRYLQAAGRSVLTSATVSAMGMPVARLSEVIVRWP